MVRVVPDWSMRWTSTTWTDEACAMASVIWPRIVSEATVGVGLALEGVAPPAEPFFSELHPTKPVTARTPAMRAAAQRVFLILLLDGLDLTPDPPTPGRGGVAGSSAPVLAHPSSADVADQGEQDDEGQGAQREGLEGGVRDAGGLREVVADPEERLERAGEDAHPRAERDEGRRDDAQRAEDPVRAGHAEGPHGVRLRDAQLHGGRDDDEIAEQVGRDRDAEDDPEEGGARAGEAHGGDHEGRRDDAREQVDADRGAEPGVEAAEEAAEERAVSGGHGLHAVGHDHPRGALADVGDGEHHHGDRHHGGGGRAVDREDGGHGGQQARDAVDAARRDDEEDREDGDRVEDAGHRRGAQHRDRDVALGVLHLA